MLVQESFIHVNNANTYLQLLPTIIIFTTIVFIFFSWQIVDNEIFITSFIDAILYQYIRILMKFQHFFLFTRFISWFSKNFNYSMFILKWIKTSLFHRIVQFLNNSSFFRSTSKAMHSNTHCANLTILIQNSTVSSISDNSIYLL